MSVKDALTKVVDDFYFAEGDKQYKEQLSKEISMSMDKKVIDKVFE